MPARVSVATGLRRRNTFFLNPQPNYQPLHVACAASREPAMSSVMEQLLAEELLLALPIVALHAENDESCTAKGPEVRDGETHRPFAGLAELIKR